MDFSNVTPEDQARLLVSASSVGDIEIMKHLVEKIKLDLSCGCKCINTAYDAKHLDIVHYLLTRESIKQSTNLESFLQRCVRDENMGLVVEVLGGTHTRPTVEMVEMAIRLKNLHLVKLLTQVNYTEEYATLVIRHCISRKCNYDEFKTQICETVLPYGAFPVSMDGNSLLIRHISWPRSQHEYQDRYSRHDTFKRIIRHPRFQITRSKVFLDALVAYRTSVVHNDDICQLIDELISNVGVGG